MVLLTAGTAEAKTPPYTVQDCKGYNSWPMMQAIGQRLVCTYSRGTSHNIVEGVRGVFARASDDGGKTWSNEVCVANEPNYGEVTIGKGFGNGFPVTAMVVREPYADAVDKISASTSYGGNPMACAAALASIEVIEEEGLLEHAQDLEQLFARRMADWTTKFNIVGDTRVKGCLLGVELVKDKASKTPFDEAGKRIYQRAFSKGLAWIPAGHILRMSPPIVMPDEVAHKGMDIIEESIGEVERELGYGR